MIEIMALLMFVGNPQELKEMTYTSGVSECLQKKRVISRNIGNSVIYMCSKVKAELSKDNKILRIEKLK
jgi:hypothetical protein|tara:strand:+ start:426 stop:632 length:207 start_codon:yes stop_codon:yes gene_type:complete